MEERRRGLSTWGERAGGSRQAGVSGMSLHLLISWCTVGWPPYAGQKCVHVAGLAWLFSSFLGYFSRVAPNLVGFV